MQRKRRKTESLLADCSASLIKIAARKDAVEDIRKAAIHNLKSYYAGGGDEDDDVDLVAIAIWILTCKRMSRTESAVEMLSEKYPDVDESLFDQMLSKLYSLQTSILVTLGWYISSAEICIPAAVSLPATVRSKIETYISQLYASDLCCVHPAGILSQAVVIVACSQMGVPVPSFENPCDQHVIDAVSKVVN
eukprot:TRINITY_DN23132_c0_g1_i1.p1 TRINITY_DN23132_c0_g1~~TRINITY_DN23132_c0_g1_i1.p1  ORF type:complete len:192 (+),score=21.37 TRINITY_DN23132_c0_g1_i1:64-639(+)